MVTRELPMENTLYSTCMQHEMPQSLLVFTVSLTPEILGRSLELHTPLEELFFFFLFLFLSVYMHMLEI